MYRLWQKIAGYSRCRILGADAGRLLMLCKCRRLYLWDICPCDGGLEAFVLTPYIRDLSETALVCGACVTVLDAYGLPVILKKAAVHKFFFFGLLSAVLIIFALSRYIWAVEVCGNSFYTDEMLSAYLAEIGAGAGSLKRHIVPSEVEENIRLKYPRISWVSARITGTKLMLDIEEGQPDMKMPDADTGDLCAPYSGTVVSMITRAGTPLVKKGDIVKKGDVLVAAGMDICGDDGTVVKTVPAAADADIVLRVRFAVDRRYDRHYIKKNDAGEAKKSYAIHLFGHTFTVPDMSRSAMSDYDETVEYKVFRLTEDFYLPFAVTVTSRKPYTQTPALYTAEEIRTIASRDFERKLETMRNDGAKLIENHTDFEVTKDDLLLTGYVIMEMPCGT